ncbi:hypothetical protein B0J14DRAFT_565628 [Halenospora varia]|nr:hypothetical protein B0J14DRAFT_565628 [Halenospora varia]
MFNTPELEMNVLIGKNPLKEISYTAETILETEEATPLGLKDIERLKVAIPRPDSGFEIAIDLADTTLRTWYKLYILGKTLDLLNFVVEKRQIEGKNDVLKKDILKVEELYTSTNAQKDSLEEQLNRIKPRVSSNCGVEILSNKRHCQE